MDKLPNEILFIIYNQLPLENIIHIQKSSTSFQPSISTFKQFEIYNEKLQIWKKKQEEEKQQQKQNKRRKIGDIILCSMLCDRYNQSIGMSALERGQFLVDNDLFIDMNHL